MPQSSSLVCVPKRTVEICVLHDEVNLNKFRRYGLTKEEFFIVQTLTPYIEDNKNYTGIKTIKLLFSGNRESGHYELLQERPACNVKMKELIEDKSLMSISNHESANDWIMAKKRNTGSDIHNVSEDERCKKKVVTKKMRNVIQQEEPIEKGIQRCIKQMPIVDKVTNS